MIWAAHALNYLSRCFANEIDTAGTLLTFKGPPKLNLTISQVANDVGELSLSEFEVVQDAAGWVFDNSREAEVKHILLSAEIARSGRADGDAGDYFKENLAAALDCAKIAYQMAVSEITKDTLKSLGDLRKAVTEETSKATDAMRVEGVARRRLIDVLRFELQHFPLMLNEEGQLAGGKAELGEFREKQSVAE